MSPRSSESALTDQAASDATNLPVIDAALHALGSGWRLWLPDALYPLYERRARDHKLALLRYGQILGAVLLGCYVLIDMLWVNHFPQPVYWAYFGLLLPLFLLALGTTLSPTLHPQAVMTTWLLLTVTGLVIGWAIVEAGGPHDAPPYMFGAMLIYIVFAYFFSGATVRMDACTAIAASLFCLGYLAACGWQGQVLVGRGYELLAMNVVGLVGRYLLERARRLEFLYWLRAKELSERDPLTGLYNRRVFSERLEALWQQARSNGLPLTTMLFDVDRFKSINDQLGHAFGDAVLRETAAALAECTGESGHCVARLGGDEFAGVWLDAPANGEQLQAAVAARYLALRLSAPEAAELPLSISIGMARSEGGKAITASALLRRADEALYRAKREGRGRLIVA